MTVASKIGDWTFKAFTAGLGIATIYMTATFSLNVYRGLSWHNEQKKAGKEGNYVTSYSEGETLPKAGKEGILQKPEEESTDQNPQ